MHKTYKQLNLFATQYNLQPNIICNPISFATHTYLHEHPVMPEPLNSVLYMCLAQRLAVQQLSTFHQLVDHPSAMTIPSYIVVLHSILVLCITIYCALYHSLPPYMDLCYIAICIRFWIVLDCVWVQHWPHTMQLHCAWHPSDQSWIFIACYPICCNTNLN